MIEGTITKALQNGGTLL